MVWCSLLAFAFLSSHIAARPTHVSEADLALITPPPTLYGARLEHAYYRRGAVGDLTSAVESYGQSLLSELGSNIPTYVTDGILPGEINLPTGTDVLSSASISSSDLAALPTKVLNIPGYGNWTENGWSLRVHGNVYKQPNISNDIIDNLANAFLIGTSIQDLPDSNKSMARNLTREIYVVQQPNVNVTVNIVPGPQFGTGGGGSTPAGINQTSQLPDETTAQGDFDIFIPIQNDSGLQEGGGDIAPQLLNVYAQGAEDTGNATSYLVPNQGITIISDIDDILRVTKIYDPKEGLLNSFARNFTPWMNMPDIYRNWSTSLPNLHFHYLTTTPEQITRAYMDFIYKTYPGGSFDTRPLNFSDVSATLSIRKYLLEKIFQTFPNRKFILVADTSNSDIMRDYPEMAMEYPLQVQCIWLRNTTATDSADHFPYNTEGFKNLSQQAYMFFLVPDDLTNLDIANGQCYNSSIKQNVTFSYQGLPFDLGSNSSSGTPTIGRNSVLMAALLLAGFALIQGL